MATYIPLWADARSHLACHLPYSQPFTNAHCTDDFYADLLRVLQSKTATDTYTFFTLIGCFLEKEVVKASLTGSITAASSPEMLNIQFTRGIGSEQRHWDYRTPIFSTVEQPMLAIILANLQPAPAPVISVPSIEENING